MEFVVVEVLAVLELEARVAIRQIHSSEKVGETQRTTLLHHEATLVLEDLLDDDLDGDLEEALGS